MSIFKGFFYLIIVILWTDCGTPKSASQTITCDTSGTIVDMTGLDGCRWMLVTDGGSKLLPQKWPKDFEPKDNLAVKFHFTEVKDVASICMAEDKIVTVDCIKPLAGKPAKPTCYNTVKPMEVEWMRIAMTRNGTKVIEKYPYLDKYAYLFKGVNLDNDLYDCQGTLLCSYREIEQNACSQRLVNLGKGVVIWRGR
ncbi:MAG TPA: hypothetical protein ENK85_09855 [Saprospiraceae bacterium]|nr:hypothetical protein [Saprospiraceae bacterium]